MNSSNNSLAFLFLAPEFIASFDIDSNVYFFFREKAEEQRDIFPKMYSRVGRLCKVIKKQKTLI